MTADAEARVATVVTDVATTTALLPLLVPPFSLLLLPRCHHYGGHVLLQQPLWLHLIAKEGGDWPNGMAPQWQFVQLL